MEPLLPLGKLPAGLLERLLAKSPALDPRVLYGPGIGRDCAVIDQGDRLLVLKSDPITFATGDIGWYAVQINANDIATTGAQPRWMLATLLLPENQTTPALVESIFDQLTRSAAALGITLIGGHTEITYGLNRPIIMGTMLGETDRDHLVLPSGARPGDRLLLTKGVPVEATALLATEFGDRLSAVLTPPEIEQARQYLYKPGISVLRDARVAVAAGRVTAMHDPTEGGLASALWEVSEASGRRIRFDPVAVPVPALSARICAFFGLNPLATIASGALLMAVSPDSAASVIRALEGEGIPCGEIGAVEEGSPGVWQAGGEPLPRPARDEITKVYETGAP